MNRRVPFLLSFFLLLLAASATAQPAGWTYYQAYTVTNNSSTLVLGHQLRLTVNTAALVTANQMQASGADIRFGKQCEGTTIYPHWIDSGMNSAATRIYIKIDSLLPNASRTFYMYWGNPAATSTSTVSIFAGPFSATNQITGGTTNLSPGACQRGFRFSPNTDILVTEFGKLEPNGTTRYLTLFDNSSQAILRQMQVPGTSTTAYQYANLPNAIWLTQGTQYILQMFSSSTEGYYYQTSSQINPNLTYVDMQFSNSSTQNTFPNSVLTNYHYGYGDFRFYTRTNVTPAPTVTAGGAGSGAQVLVQPPATLSTCPGTPLLIPAVTGGPVTGRLWQLNTGSGWTDLSNGSAYAGVTTDTLRIASATLAYNTYQYRLRIAGGTCAGYAYSNVATLSISPANAAVAQITYNSPLGFCQGSAVVLNALTSTSYSYQWMRDGQPIPGATGPNYTALSTGGYSLRVSNTLQCVDTADVVSVTVYEKPPAAITANGLQLAAPAGYAAYQWLINGSDIMGATAPAYTIAQNGVYAVRLVNDKGCDSTSLPFYLGNLSVFATGAGKAIRIYPNPVQDKLQIESPVPVAATLRAADGRLILHSAAARELDLSALPAGTYLLLLTDERGQSLRSERVVKRR